MITIREFTDPTCPWAFSAEPTRLRLMWLFGDCVMFERRMIVLSESGEEYLMRGFDPPRQAEALTTIAREHGMPIDAAVAARMLATVVPCTAVVAARLNSPAHEVPLLRRLRVLKHGGELVDERSVIASAATDVGLDSAALEVWMGDPGTEQALRGDMQLARTPSPAALALNHKLASTSDGRRRYTAPSYELTGPSGRRLDIPGFNPALTYEVAIANLDSTLIRRDDPASVEEVLAWAAMPLATVEVAAVMARPIADTRAALSAAHASFEQVGSDGYWTHGEPTAATR